MKSDLIKSFQQFQNVLVICPECGEIHRLSELKLSYRGRVKRTWLDELRENEMKMQQKEEKFKNEKATIKTKAKEEEQRKIPGLIKKCIPFISSKGYYPQDLHTVFDPIDFVVFDGMTLKDKVERVVFLDSQAGTKKRENTQNSMKKAIKKGNYDWNLVRLSDEGKIIK